MEGVMKRPISIIPLVYLLCIAFGCQKGEKLAAGKEVEPTITVNSAISADGISIAYEVRGEGEPALVFVHGWCCDRSYWDAQLPYFAKKYKAVAIDLAGHGESGLGRKEWTMGAFGEDVVEVANKLALDRVVFVGHSMGGAVILEAARRMPKRVIGLVGVDTLQDFEEKYTQEQIQEMFAPLRSDFAESVRDFVHNMFPPNSDLALVEKIAIDMSAAPQEVGLGALQGFVDFHNNEIIRVLQEVRAPITCISSDKYPTNVETNRIYSPSFQAKIMSGVGHFNMIEDPETFNRLLEETIQEFVRTEKQAKKLPS
jgi:pimeloyl-ACP methyl ester carboxylesterase